MPAAITISTTPRDATVPVERMRITNTGNVGIGTATPNHKLDVNGTLRANNLYIENSGGDSSIEIGGAGNVFIDLKKPNSDDYDLRIGTDGTNGVVESVGSFGISTVATERMRITNTGNVGIGTAAPTTKLDVNGAITASTDSYINGIRIGRGGGGVSYNTAIGTYTLTTNTTGNYNTAIGNDALYSNISGSNNTALGTFTLYNNTTGAGNIAIGNDALNKNTTGNWNCAFGQLALYKNTIGSYNVGIGYGALFNSTTASNSIAIGNDASGNTTTGCNISLGYASLKNNITGSFNTSIGYQALTNNRTSLNNVAIGDLALINATIGVATVTITSGNSGLTPGTYPNVVTSHVSGPTAFSYPWLNIVVASGGTISSVVVSASGSGFTGDSGTVISATIAGKTVTFTTSTFAYSNQNTAIGYGAGRNLATGSNNIFIGYDAGTDSWNNFTNVSNTIVLGNTNITSARCKSVWITTSDKRDKTSFTPVPHGLEFVNALKPTAYRFKKDRESDEPQEDSRVRYGFLAQDILELEGEQPVIIDNSNPDCLGIAETSLIPVLVNAIKELSAELQSIKEELAKIKQ